MITHKGKTTQEYISKYPDMPHKTLARLLRKDHPKVYNSIENARCSVRVYKGRAGSHRRDNLIERRFMLPAPTKKNPLSLPDGIKESQTPYIIPERLEKILVIGDVHVPFHDVKALTAALQYDRDIDGIIINGDFADCYSLSRFEKNPELRNFPKERESVCQALMAIRKMFPKAWIIYREGNHEARYRKMLETNAPDLIGLSEFRLEVIFDLFNLGIEWIDQKRLMQYRELDILHGHELPAKTGGVNPARTALLKARSCCIVSHYHRKTNDIQRTLRNEYIQAWSLGCLCDLSPQYMPINDWVHGFAIVHGGKHWSVDNHTVIKGRVL